MTSPVTQLAAPSAHVRFVPAPTSGRARLRFMAPDDPHDPVALIIRWAHDSGAVSDAQLSHAELAYLAHSAFGDLITQVRAADTSNVVAIEVAR